MNSMPRNIVDNPMRIAIFASGGGSNFQAIVDAAAAGTLPVSVELLVCDRPRAQVIERANRLGIRVFTFRPKDYSSREQYEDEIVQLMNELQIDLVVFAGYMRLITEALIRPYYGRIINIHPSLLPAFPGIHAIEQALAYGVKITGVTVHFVDGGMDTGPIIAQRAVALDETETEETLAAKIHAVEHELYPQVIQQFSQGKVRLDGAKVKIIENESIESNESDESNES